MVIIVPQACRVCAQQTHVDHKTLQRSPSPVTNEGILITCSRQVKMHLPNLVFVSIHSTGTRSTTYLPSGALEDMPRVRLNFILCKAPDHLYLSRQADSHRFFYGLQVIKGPPVKRLWPALVGGSMRSGGCADSGPQGLGFELNSNVTPQSNRYSGTNSLPCWCLMVGLCADRAGGGTVSPGKTEWRKITTQYVGFPEHNVVQEDPETLPSSRSSSVTQLADST